LNEYLKTICATFTGVTLALYLHSYLEKTLIPPANSNQLINLPTIIK